MKYLVQYRSVYAHGTVVGLWVTFNEADSWEQGRVLAQEGENLYGDATREIAWAGWEGTVTGKNGEVIGQYRVVEA